MSVCLQIEEEQQSGWCGFTRLQQMVRGRRVGRLQSAVYDITKCEWAKYTNPRSCEAGVTAHQQASSMKVTNCQSYEAQSKTAGLVRSGA